MNKIFYAIVILLSNHIFYTSSAMEQKSKAHSPILRKMHDIQFPRSGQFISEREAIISDEKGARIFDTITGNQLKEIDGIPFPHVAVHPNRKLCALTNGAGVKIYDITTGELIQSIFGAAAVASVFDPLNDNVISLLYHSRHTFKCHNYGPKPELIYTDGYGQYGQTSPALAFHPTETILCSARNKDQILFYDTYNTKELKILNNPSTVAAFDTANFSSREHLFCQFSSDGSLLMSGEKHGFCVKNKNGSLLNVTFKQERTLHDVIFHPNGKVLIVLSQPNNDLSFWEIPARRSMIPKQILSLSCSSSEDNHQTKHEHMQRCLSCDPSGDNLLIILSHDCFVMPMPFEVIYQSYNRKECIFAFFALQHELPKDIRRVLVRKLLTLCKREQEEK